MINAVRNIRGENNIPPSKEISLQILSASNDRGSAIKTYGSYLKKLGRVENVEMISAKAKPKLASSAVVDGVELFVPLAGLIDVAAVRLRLEKEIARLQALVDSIEKKLSNAQFVERAPKDVVEKEREKQTSFKANIEKLRSNLQHLTAKYLSLRGVPLSGFRSLWQDSGKRNNLGLKRDCFAQNARNDRAFQEKQS